MEMSESSKGRDHHIGTSFHGNQYKIMKTFPNLFLNNFTRFYLIGWVGQMEHYVSF